MFGSLTTTGVVDYAGDVVAAIGPVYLIPIGLSVALGLVWFAVKLARKRR